MTKDNQLTIRECDDNEVETNLVSDFNKPVYVQYEGKINEITIYFKPLAINAFLEQDLSHYNSSNFSEFSPFEDYRKDEIEDDENVELQYNLQRYYYNSYQNSRGTALENYRKILFILKLIGENK